MKRNPPPESAEEWIRRAHSNLTIAAGIRAGIDVADLCFDAQQAAEKAVKAVFVHRGEAFPYSHDLDRLLSLLEATSVKIPKYVRRAKALTRFALVTRYPGMAPPVKLSEYRQAVRTAGAVLRWAERQIARP